MTRYQGHHGQGSMLEQLARVQEEHRRPGGVVLAGWLTILLSAGWVVLGVVYVVRSQEVVDWILSRPEMIQAMPQTDPELERMLLDVLPVTGVVSAIVGVIGVLLGRGVLNRRRGARTWLTVTSVLMVLGNLGAVLEPVMLPYLLGPIVVIVGIRNAAAKRWFAGASHRY